MLKHLSESVQQTVTPEKNLYLSSPGNERSYLHQYYCCVRILSQ